MEDRRSIAKKAAIGVALVIAAAGAVLFYKNNIATRKRLIMAYEMLYGKKQRNEDKKHTTI